MNTAGQALAFALMLLTAVVHIDHSKLSCPPVGVGQILGRQLLPRPSANRRGDGVTLSLCVCCALSTSQANLDKFAERIQALLPKDSTVNLTTLGCMPFTVLFKVTRLNHSTSIQNRAAARGFSSISQVVKIEPLILHTPWRQSLRLALGTL